VLTQLLLELDELLVQQMTDDEMVAILLLVLCLFRQVEDEEDDKLQIKQVQMEVLVVVEDEDLREVLELDDNELMVQQVMEEVVLVLDEDERLLQDEFQVRLEKQDEQDEQVQHHQFLVLL